MAHRLASENKCVLPAILWRSRRYNREAEEKYKLKMAEIQ